jgi:CO/xanthine dehydrogenase FAD-binding subunit
MQAEMVLKGQRVSAELIARAAAVAAANTTTRSSHRASAEYRGDMIEVLVRRALTQVTQTPSSQS